MVFSWVFWAGLKAIFYDINQSKQVTLGKPYLECKKTETFKNATTPFPLPQKNH